MSESEWTPRRERIGRALGARLAYIEACDESTINETEDGHPIALPSLVDVVETLLREERTAL